MPLGPQFRQEIVLLPLCQVHCAVCAWTETERIAVMNRTVPATIETTRPNTANLARTEQANHPLLITAPPACGSYDEPCASDHRAHAIRTWRAATRRVKTRLAQIPRPAWNWDTS